MKKDTNSNAMIEGLKSLQKEKGISEEQAVGIITEVFSHVITKKIDPNVKIEVEVDFKKSKFKIFNTNAEVVDLPDNELEPIERVFNISLEKARETNPDVKEEDIVTIKLEKEWLSKKIRKIIASSFKQRIIEWFKNTIFEKYTSLKGQQLDVVIEGINDRSGGVTIKLLDDNTHGYMPKKLRNPNVKLEVGNITKLYLEDVKKETKKNDAQLIMSNGSAKTLKYYLEVEIPEIASGDIEIKKISRLTGVRAKIAVTRSENAPKDIDPVGSIIGIGGSRINEISNKLGGEKIDVIRYDEDIEKFIINAISPAKVVAILKKNGTEERNHFVVVVPDEDNTKAIGIQGRNVSLTVELTNSRIDIISVTDAKANGMKYKENGNYLDNSFSYRGTSEKSKKFDTTINMQEFESEIAEYTKNMQEHITNTSEIDYQMPRQNTSTKKVKATTLEALKSDTAIYDKNDSIRNEKSHESSKSVFSGMDIENINKEFAFSEDEYGFDISNGFDDDDWE